MIIPWKQNRRDEEEEMVNRAGIVRYESVFVLVPADSGCATDGQEAHRDEQGRTHGWGMDI